MIRAVLAFALLVGVGSAAHAQVTTSAPVTDTSGFATTDQLNAVAAAAATPTDVASGTYTIATLPAANTLASKRVIVTDLGGGAAYVTADGPNNCWKRVGQLNSYQVLAADANGSLTYLTQADVIQATGGLTTNRTWSISTVQACKGAYFRVIRALVAGDTWTLMVNGTNVANGQTVDFHFDGTAWVPGGNSSGRAQTAQSCTLTTTGGRTIYDWTYPAAYGASVVPFGICTVQAPAGSASLYNCQVDGVPTNTTARFVINQVPTGTVSLTGLLSLSLFQAAPTNTCISMLVKQPG